MKESFILLLILLFVINLDSSNGSIKENLKIDNPYCFKSDNDLFKSIYSVIYSCITNPINCFIKPKAMYPSGNPKGIQCSNTNTCIKSTGPDLEKEGGLCYTKCRDNYNGVGPVCWERCNNDQIDVGALCRNRCTNRDGVEYKEVAGVCWEKNCPSNHRDDGATCFQDLKCNSRWDNCKDRAPKWLGGKCIGGLVTDCSGPNLYKKKSYVPTTTAKKSYGRGVGKIPNVCPDPDTKLSGLLCEELSVFGKIYNRIKYI